MDGEGGSNLHNLLGKTCIVGSIVAELTKPDDLIKIKTDDLIDFEGLRVD